MRRKINNIQLLRALAALSVAMFHTGYHLPHMRQFGFFGVSVFFVISGYIMAMICNNKADYFLTRRIVRIVPPYWGVTILLFVFAHFWPELLKATHASIPDLLKSFFFIPFRKSDGLIQPLLFLGWSLNYEMFFYLALAVGLRVWRRRATTFAAGVIFLTLFLCGFFAKRSVIAGFFSNTMMLDFVLGMAAFYLCREFPQGVSRRLRPLLLIGAVAAFGMLIFIEGRAELGVQPLWILLGLPSFVLVTSVTILSQSGWDSNLSWLVILGDASYILYLIHPYIEYAIGRVVVRRVPWMALETIPGCLFALAVSVCIAVLLHLKFERPVVNALNRRLTRRAERVAIAA